MTASCGMAEHPHPVNQVCDLTHKSIFDSKEDIRKNETDVEEQDNKKISLLSSGLLDSDIADYIAKVSSKSEDFKPKIKNFLGKNLLNYELKLDFALKLGYTELLAQIALSRVGSNPTQNELLAELIKLQNNSKFNSDDSKDVSYDGITSKSRSYPHLRNNSLLRPIIIDGSNVAISHGNKEVFSCRGIKLCVDWFKKRGHTDITVFVPKWRKENNRFDNPIKDQEILNDLERNRMLVFTPSRLIGGKRMVCYDDRYILKLAVENEGIIVSNDNYRDLIKENTEFKKVVEERTLMYSFVNDRFMPPDDPLGRQGPTLDNFLRIIPRKTTTSSFCPYGKKCTYGNRCKYHHPEKDLGANKLFMSDTSEFSSNEITKNESESRTVKSKNLAKKAFSYPLNASRDASNDIKNQLNVKMSKKRLCRSKSNKDYVNEFDQASKTNQRNLSPCSSFENFRELDKSHSVGNIFKKTCNKFTKSNQHENKKHTPPTADKLFKILPKTEAMDSDISIHRKLRRQLTLNVVCGDEYSKSFLEQKTHKSLAPSCNDSSSQHFILENSHQDVTRTASAPGPSTSSEIHLPSLWEIRNNFPSEQEDFIAQEIEDKRCKLYYHLSNVFPQNQVLAIMKMHPKEINPQKICAGILSLYSND